MVGVVGPGGRATVQSVTSGVTGISNDQDLFGIKLPSIGGIIKKAAGFIPGVGPIIQELLPGGGGVPGGGLTPQGFAGPDCAFGFSRDFPGAPCTFDPIPGPIGGTRGGGGGGQTDFGEARVGQFGVGMEPAVRSSQTRVCLPGMQLGKDGLCYNNGVLQNKQREWPKGRRPLLTGGDMRAISTASRASKRLQATSKRLQKMGMIPKPPVRRAASKQIAPGVPVGMRIVNVD